MTNPKITPELEAMARAMAQAAYKVQRGPFFVGDDLDDKIVERNVPTYIPLARAALSTLLVPSEGMVEQVMWHLAQGHVDISPSTAKWILELSISHILGESTQ